MDLVTAIRRISWRYFLSLLTGLSGDSRFFSQIRQNQEQQKDVIDDDEAIALFDSFAS